MSLKPVAGVACIGVTVLDVLPFIVPGSQMTELTRRDHV